MSISDDLVVALLYGRDVILESMIVSNPALVLVHDSSGNYPLHLAQTKKAVQVILRANKTVTGLRNLSSELPIHHMARLGSSTALRSMLEEMEPNTLSSLVRSTILDDECHSTALDIAVEYNRLECVFILLQYGASVDELDGFPTAPLYMGYRLTPLALAFNHRHFKAVELLIQYGASIKKTLDCIDVYYTAFKRSSGNARFEMDVQCEKQKSIILNYLRSIAVKDGARRLCLLLGARGPESQSPLRLLDQNLLKTIMFYAMYAGNTLFQKSLE